MKYEEVKRIGRNSSCLCGSGKKYKHCCLKNSIDSMTTINDGQSVYKGIGKNNKGILKVMDAIHYITNKKCILCGNKPDFAAMFSPTAEFAKQIGKSQEKLITLFYSICKDCQKMPDCSQKIEDIFAKEYDEEKS